MTIPQSILEAAIAALEIHAQHPGTGALHDPVYAMLQGEDEAAALQALGQALASGAAHPAASALRAILGEAVVLPEPSIEAVLAKHGGIGVLEPVEEVDSLLTDARETRRVLSARIDALEAQAAALGRMANGLAAVGALLAMFGLIGWLVALGRLEIAWIEAPVPEHISEAAAGGGTVAPSQRRVR